LTDKQPYSFRAAWLLCLTIKRNDPRLRSFVPEIISVLPLIKYSQQRQLLIILQQMEIPQELEGQLFDLCMTLWENTRNQQSVRSNALKIMLLIAKKYPELQDEIHHLTDDRYLENFSHGIRHSVTLMIQKI
ncbi:MAG: hypothetical protein LBN23_04885, partial [Paludibacter sp.]|jgi:hypothetical protein|nr:hypothetical protein [Paludibacter sp.]